MRLRRLGLPLLLGAVTAAYGQSGDGPPTTPDALISRAYSGTAGALSWQRSTDDNGVRAYEVTRNGVVLAVADRLSYVDTELQPGQNYDYRVVAIDTVGQRSGAALTTLETPHVPGSFPAPAGLRINLYSSTALGLAWTRSAQFGVRYEISRDGEVIAETGATSLVESGLQPGARHVYTVVAVGRNGSRSAPSRIAATMPAGGQGPSAPPDPPVQEPPPAEPAPPDIPGTDTLARLGYLTVRDLANGLVSASYLSLYLDVDDDIALLPAPVVIGSTRLNCAEGGRVSVTLEQVSRPAITRFEFTDCAIAGRRLSGVLERRVDTSDRPGVRSRTVSLVFGGLQVAHAQQGSVRLAGTSVRVTAETDNARCPRQPDTLANVNTDLSSVRLTVASATYELADARYNSREAVEAACQPIRSLRFGGSARVTSSEFGDGTANFVKRGQIVRDGRVSVATATGATAELRADFADGSSLSMSVLSDVDSRVQMSVVSGGTTETFEDVYRFTVR